MAQALPNRWRRILLPCSMMALGLACGDTSSTKHVPSAPAPAVPAVPPPPAPPPAAPPKFVGTARCGECHATPLQTWAGSHHDLAMQSPAGLALPGFDGRSLTVGRERFTFRHDASGYVVDVETKPTQASESPSSVTYPVRYVFGTSPLAQVLLDVGGGHLQALSVAWDTRSEAAGGQRWFSLHPDEEIPPGDALHWKGPQFNWNHQCADCHSTGVEKNYDRKGHGFATAYAEIDVGCEACHGPGSGHVEAVRAGQPTLRVAGFRPLVAPPSRRWVLAPGAPIAHLEPPTVPTDELESCAPCHSRRSDLGPSANPDQPDESFHDRHRLSLLDEAHYFADGQIEDEVFEYGSFLQSRMHRAGVLCSDCHEPHALTLVARGNALCSSCHRPEVFDTQAHHFHSPGTAGAECVNCHMPERTYMVLDGRRDHRFGVPQPELSASIGAPDPCTGCHRDRTAPWAAAEIGKRKTPVQRRPTFAHALHATRTQQPGARAALAAVITNADQPAIARATALEALVGFPGDTLWASVETSLKDPSPLVRRAATSAARALPTARRQAVLARALQDSVRSVRIEAADVLLSFGLGEAQGRSLPGLQSAMDELVAAREWQSDRAEGLAAMAHVRASEGDVSAAEVLLKEALQRDPSYSPAYVNLSDLYRATLQEESAMELLGQGVNLAADPAPLHHARGLAHIRGGNVTAALADLGRALELAPGVSRYAYVYAIALHDAGERQRARDVLSGAIERAPGNEALLSVLIDYSRQAGLQEDAERHARTLTQLRATP